MRRPNVLLGFGTLLSFCCPPTSGRLAHDISFGELEKSPKDDFYHGTVSADDAVKMYSKWMDTGFSSLFSVIANSRLKKQRRSVTVRFGECSSKAQDLTDNARCLSRLLRNKFSDGHTTTKKRTKAEHFERLQRYRQHDSKDQVGGFRIREKREIKVHQADSYQLSEHRRVFSPLSQATRMVLEGVKTARNKTVLPHWTDTLQKLRENGALLKKRQKEAEEEAESEESLSSMGLRAVKQNLGEHGADPDVDFDQVARNRTQLNQWLRAQKKKRGEGKAGVEHKVMGLFRDAIKLAYSLAGQNTTDFDRKNLHMASPRFLGLVPEEVSDDVVSTMKWAYEPRQVSLISPSLFSLHNEGQGLENLTSLPNLLKGMPIKDQELWLDVIMEAAGVNEHSEQLEQQVEDVHVERTRELMNVSRLVDENGKPYYATPENITKMGADPAALKVWEKLHTSYTKDQLHAMNTTGYAVLKHDQVRLLYGPKSPMNNSAMHDRLLSMNESEVHAQMEQDIHDLAELRNFQLRKKDIVGSPVLFVPAILAPRLLSQAFILSPVLFTPVILSPSVFGAVILSPWVFVPFVLSPRVLGTLVLAPFMFSPLILTPLALHPAILSPGVFNPLILTPAVLTPLILSPQVFSPPILTPLCLSPLILNPLVGSPLILSPFVLSPIILSPQALGALILSPYALSPVILSPLVVFAAVLSPSFLS